MAFSKPIEQLWDMIRGIAPNAAVTTLSGGGSVVILGAIARIAREILGKPPIDDPLTDTEASGMLTNSEAFFQFKIKLQELETAKLKAVVAEAKKIKTIGDAWQRRWRPFNGYLAPVILVWDYLIAPLIVAEPQHIPWQIYVVWFLIVGVTAVSRGFEKIAETKRST